MADKKQRDKCYSKYQPPEIVVFINQTALHIAFMAHVNNHEYPYPVGDQRQANSCQVDPDSGRDSPEVKFSVKQREQLPYQKVAETGAAVSYLEYTHVRQIDKDSLYFEIYIKKTE